MMNFAINDNMRLPEKTFLSGCLCIAATMLFCGCGGDGRLPASGSVTLDGKPLAAGSISFVPAPGSKVNSCGATIADGKYAFLADKGLFPGKYRVSVVAMVKSGRQVKNPLSGEMEDEQYPVSYREAGKLEAEINAGAENKFDFTLTQKKKTDKANVR